MNRRTRRARRGEEKREFFWQHFVAADSTTTKEGLANLRAAVERLKSDPTRVLHPVLGKLTIEEWDNFNLRHAELHLSFAVPQ